MSRDVRMRGFRERTPVEDAQAWVDALAVPERAERVPLSAAAGRALWADCIAACDVPAFARAAMDGWALVARRTFGAEGVDARTLRVIGASMPGRPFGRAVGDDEAVRIMTGAPLPAGADAVLPAEEGEERDGRLEVRGAVTPGRHVGAAGEDVRAGEVVLRRGRRLRPQDLGLLSSLGRADTTVFERPRVAILATGDEILPAGTPPRDALVADANTPMLAALVERDGGVVAASALLHDDAEAIADALAASPGDATLVCGGSSVGQEDHAPRVLATLGVLAIHGVTLRPASPAGMGLLRDRPVFLLPGNPVSCLCAYDLFAGRWVRRAAGRPADLPHARRTARLARKVASVLGRVDYVRVRLAGSEVEPLMARGASILSSTTEADGFLLVPAHSEGFPEGAEVQVHLYDPRPS